MRSPDAMRLLLVAHNSLPHHRAGVEAYTHQLAQQMGKTGPTTVAATRKVISLPTGTVRGFEYDGVDSIEVVNNLDGDSVESTWRHPTMERAFREILERVRPDVVHFQHLMYWSAELPRIAKEAGCRALLTLHDFFLMCARMGQLIDHRGAMCPGPETDRCSACMAATPWGQTPEARRWIRRLTTIRRWTGIPLDGPMRALERARSSLRGMGRSSAAATRPPLDGPHPDWPAMFRARTDAFLGTVEHVDRFLAPSETLRQRFIAWGIPADRTCHIRNGLDPAPFANVRRRPSSRLRLGFIGTIAPHKGVRDLIDAVRRLPPAAVQLVIYGPSGQHPGYAHECRRAAASAPNIEFRGWLTRAEVPAAYEDIDVLCVPSRWDECAPLTIQEAFLAKVPCVVSGRGGMAELVCDGVDGLHARSGDVDDWERVLRRLVDEPGLHERLARAVPSVQTTAEHVDLLKGIYGA